MKWTAQRTTNLLIAVLLLFSTVLIYRLAALERGVTKVIETDRQARQTMTTTWVDVNGTTQTVTTDRNAGESVADFQTRHFNLVKAAQEDHPPKEEEE